MNKQPEDPEELRSAPTAWAYASEGTQITVTLLLGLYLGYKADGYWQIAPWGMVTGAFLGIAVGLYGFLRRVLKW